MPKGITIYKTIIFIIDSFIIITFTRKASQIFCATNKCDSDLKNGVLY